MLLKLKTGNLTFALPASSFFCLSSSSIAAVPVATTRGTLIHARYQRVKLVVAHTAPGSLPHTSLALTKYCLLVDSPPPCFPRKHEGQPNCDDVVCFRWLQTTPPAFQTCSRAIRNVAFILQYFQLFTTHNLEQWYNPIVFFSDKGSNTNYASPPLKLRHSNRLNYIFLTIIVYPGRQSNICHIVLKLIICFEYEIKIQKCNIEDNYIWWEN